MQRIWSTIRPPILLAVVLFVALTAGLMLLMRSNSAIPGSPPVAEVIPAPTPIPTPTLAATVTHVAPTQDLEVNAGTDDRADKTDTEPDAPSSAVEIGEPETVAIVNGQVIQRRDVERVRRIDTFMAAWLQRPPPGELFETVSQMINGLLVRQAATEADVSSPEIDLERQLLSLLGVATATDPALIAALDRADLDYESVLLHVSELLQVADQSRRLAQQQGVSVPDVLRNLQAQARISFGSGAQSETRADVEPAMAADALPSQTPEATSLSLTTLDYLAGEMSEGDGTVMEGAEVGAPDSTTQPPEPAAAPGSAAPVHSDVPAENAEEQAPRPRGIHAGNYAPLFDLPTIDPALPEIKLGDLEGSPILLSFWTTWCPYCRAQTPTLNEAHARYSNLGIRFVGINVRESREQVESYVAANDVPFLNAIDVNGVAANAYQLQGFPTTYFLDSQGRIFARHIGSLSEEQVDDYLTRLLQHDATLQE